MYHYMFWCSWRDRRKVDSLIPEIKKASQDQPHGIANFSSRNTNIHYLWYIMFLTTCKVNLFCLKREFRRYSLPQQSTKQANDPPPPKKSKQTNKQNKTKLSHKGDGPCSTARSHIGCSFMWLMYSHFKYSNEY